MMMIMFRRSPTANTDLVAGQQAAGPVFRNVTFYPYP